MFYNLKINSNKSEFSLESEDRLIVAREMDLYFSYFFDTSEEFKSKIKKVEITQLNVKSIEDFGDDKKAEDIKIIPNVDLKNQVDKVEPESSINTEIKVTTIQPVSKQEDDSVNDNHIEEIKISQDSHENPEIIIKQDDFQEELQINISDNLLDNQTNQTEEVIDNAITLSINDGHKEIIEKNIESVITEVEVSNQIKEVYKDTSFSVNAEENENPDAVFDFVKTNDEEDEDQDELSFQEDDDEIMEIAESEEISVEELLNRAANKLDELDIEKTTLKEDISDVLSGKAQVKMEFKAKEITPEVDVIQNANQETKSEENDLIQIDIQEEKNEEDEISNTIQELDNNANLKTTELDLNNNAEEIQIDSQIRIEELEAEPEDEFEIKSSDEIFETPTVVVDDLSDNPVELPCTPLNSQVQNKEVTFAPEPTFAQNVQKAIEEFENQAPSVVSEQKEYSIEPQEEVKIEARQINLEEEIPTQKVEVAKQENISENKIHDFGDFIKNFKYEKTVDEFLICSYYIKNIANEDSFTMKAINSKLFRATGKIAGMSILNELVQNKYIEIVDDGDIKKYSITDAGEEYFAEKFQG